MAQHVPKSLVIKWAGKEIVLEDFQDSTTVKDLKNMITERTNVLPARQKLLNLKHKGEKSKVAKT